MSEPFLTVTHHRFKPIYKDSEVDLKAVCEFLRVSRTDLSKTFGVTVASVRFDDRMPAKQRDYLMKCAAAIDHVAEFFSDQRPKIEAWFSIRNPMLGGVPAIDFVKSGRIDKLLQFIIDAKNGNLP